MAWIYLNKPPGIRSVKALNIVKKKLNLKKAGIAGILDEFAGGLLPIATNETTKSIDIYKDTILKQYIFTIQWGIKTNTGDYTGNIIEQNNPIITEKAINDIIPDCIGFINQTPPIFSNIKINGVRAHQLARQGIVVNMASKTVFIKSLELINHYNNHSTFKVTVGNGTYIRSLGEDLAKKLNTFGHLIYLYRSKIIINEQEIIPTIDLNYFIELNQK